MAKKDPKDSYWVAASYAADYLYDKGKRRKW